MAFGVFGQIVGRIIMLKVAFGEIVRLSNIYFIIQIEQNVDVEVHVNSGPRGRLRGQGSNLQSVS